MLASTAFAKGVEPVILLRLDFENNLPYVHATIGLQDYSLMVDLGDNAEVTLAAKALENQAVRIEQGGVTYLDVKGNKHVSRIFELNDLAIDGQSVGSVSGKEETRDLGQLTRDGSIGWGFLKRFGVVIDFSKSELRLYPAESTQAMSSECGGRGFPVKLAEGVEATGRLDGRTQRVIFDTGAQASVIRPSSTNAPRSKTPNGEGFLGTLRSRTIHFGNTAAGPVDLHLYPFQEPQVDVFLGYDFFVKNRLCIQARSRMAWIRRMQ